MRTEKRNPLGLLTIACIEAELMLYDYHLHRMKPSIYKSQCHHCLGLHSYIQICHPNPADIKPKRRSANISVLSSTNLMHFALSPYFTSECIGGVGRLFRYFGSHAIHNKTVTALKRPQNLIQILRSLVPDFLQSIYTTSLIFTKTSSNPPQLTKKAKQRSH